MINKIVALRRFVYQQGKKIVDVFIRQIQYMVDRILDGVRLIPILVRNPAVARFWLLSARSAQITLLVILLIVPAILHRVLDTVLEKMYPPITQKKFLGLVETTQTDQRLRSRQQLARIILWMGSGGLVMVLFVLHIPAAIKGAEVRSRKLEREADTLLNHKPARSILLYHSSLRLATDAEHIAALEEKISLFDKKLLNTVNNSSHTQKYSKALSGNDKTVMPSSTKNTTETTVLDNDQTLSYIGPGGRYQVKGTLGRGAMGITYRAYDIVLERYVALKELLANLAHDEELVSRFRQEAKVLAKLTHPGIVQVHDFVEEKGRIWIVMELIKGGELADLLNERGLLMVPEVARLGVQIAEAMAYSHACGIVHRDLKPSNILITEGGSPKITDFGLAKLAQSNQHTQAGTVLGSPFYMSPEQANGKGADSRSDIYAMGVILYQMLSGKVPFEGEDIASVLAQHINKEPMPLRQIVEDIPKKLEKLILAMLAKNPDQRIQDMTSFSKTLQTYVSG